MSKENDSCIKKCWNCFAESEIIDMVSNTGISFSELETFVAVPNVSPH